MAKKSKYTLTSGLRDNCFNESKINKYIKAIKDSLLAQIQDKNFDLQRFNTKDVALMCELTFVPMELLDKDE